MPGKAPARFTYPHSFKEQVTKTAPSNQQLRRLVGTSTPTHSEMREVLSIIQRTIRRYDDLLTLLGQGQLGDPIQDAEIAKDCRQLKTNFEKLQDAMLGFCRRIGHGREFAPLPER